MVDQTVDISLRCYPGIGFPCIFISRSPCGGQPIRLPVPEKGPPPGWAFAPPRRPCDKAGSSLGCSCWRRSGFLMWFPESHRPHFRCWPNRCFRRTYSTVRTSSLKYNSTSNQGRTAQTPALRALFRHARGPPCFPVSSALSRHPAPPALRQTGGGRILLLPWRPHWPSSDVSGSADDRGENPSDLKRGSSPRIPSLVFRRPRRVLF